MNTIKKILIPVDFCPSSITAVNYALGMTKSDRDIEFMLIHVESPNHKTDISLVDLENLKSELFTTDNIKCTVKLAQGDLIEVLAETKKANNINLIVMGTSGSQDPLIESNTSRLIKMVDCPAFVIPENTGAFAIKNIALALDANDFDDPTNLSLLHDLARWYKAKVHLLTIDRDNSERPIVLGEQAKTLEYYLDNLEYRHSFPKNSDIEAGINKYIVDKKIDVLAILPRHHAKNSEPSEGQLTKLLAMRSNVPLLVID